METLSDTSSLEGMPAPVRGKRTSAIAARAPPTRPPGLWSAQPTRPTSIASQLLVPGTPAYVVPTFCTGTPQLETAQLRAPRMRITAPPGVFLPPFSSGLSQQASRAELFESDAKRDLAKRLAEAVLFEEPAYVIEPSRASTRLAQPRGEEQRGDRCCMAAPGTWVVPLKLDFVS